MNFTKVNVIDMKETERELLMKLCSLFEVVEIDKQGVITYWRWDFVLDKLVRFK